jgi:N-acetylglutamate synthase-like GNAT family acetyltransferase
MITIQSYAPQHRSGIPELIVPIQQKEFGIPITLEDQPDLLDIPSFYKKGNGNFWVALSDAEVVGSIGLLDIGNNQGALRKMFVKPEYRGSEHGIARQLLSVLIDWCKSYNIRNVYLGTTEKFLAAHRFYEKNGFSLINVEDLPASFPRMAVDTRFYSLSVPSE